MKRLFIFLFFLPSLAFSFNKYDLCEVNGFFAATDEPFLASLAGRHNYKSGFHNDSQCRAIYASAYQVGKKSLSLIQRASGFSETESQTLMKADEFKNKVLDTILKLSDITPS